MSERDCNSLYTNIILFIDEELEAPQVEELQIHVGECENCTDRLETERALLLHMKQRLSDACTEEIPTRFYEQLLSQIHQLSQEQMAAEALINPFAAFTTFQSQTVISTFSETHFTHTQIVQSGDMGQIEIHIETVTHESPEEFPQ